MHFNTHRPLSQASSQFCSWASACTDRLQPERLRGSCAHTHTVSGPRPASIILPLWDYQSYLPKYVLGRESERVGKRKEGKRGRGEGGEEKPTHLPILGNNSQMRAVSSCKYFIECLHEWLGWEAAGQSSHLLLTSLMWGVQSPSTSLPQGVCALLSTRQLEAFPLVEPNSGRKAEGAGSWAK